MQKIIFLSLKKFKKYLKCPALDFERPSVTSGRDAFASAAGGGAGGGARTKKIKSKTKTSGQSK